MTQELLGRVHRELLDVLNSINQYKIHHDGDDFHELLNDVEKALAQPERHELQAKGEHPAPCARHCEANAFQIVIKNLKAQLAQPVQEPVVDDIASILACRDMLDAQPVPPRTEQEPVCPECKAVVLYECVACSSNNYPLKENK